MPMPPRDQPSNYNSTSYDWIGVPGIGKPRVKQSNPP